MEMKTSTQILSEEHENILKVIDALVMECDEIEAGKGIDKAFFEKAIDFIRNYADKFHHAKEEDILFKELCKDNVQLHCNPVEQMLYEHDLGRGFVRDLEQGLRENNRSKVVENARGYIQLLQEHIFKEDNILYPMADNVLDQKTQNAMLEEFRKTESKKFPKDKYLRIVKEFKDRVVKNE
jgi:hemerythrin-like domain-containing protein